MDLKICWSKFYKLHLVKDKASQTAHFWKEMFKVEIRSHASS